MEKEIKLIVCDVDGTILPSGKYEISERLREDFHKAMKKGIHPDNYRPVVFKDMSNEDVFITRSTINAKETIEIDGVTYPLVKIEISSSSHPFYTGKAKLVDTAGRVDKFMSRYGNRNKK